MRFAGSRLRRTAVLLLLALRARRWALNEARGLRGPRRLGAGPVGAPASDGREPSPGRAGIRTSEGEDRGPHCRAYLYLEVRSDRSRRTPFGVLTRCTSRPRPEECGTLARRVERCLPPAA